MKPRGALAWAAIALAACDRGGASDAATTADSGAVDATTVDAATVDAVADVPDATDATAPTLRLLAPSSGAVVTTRRPAFRWVTPPGAGGAQIELCATRACDPVELAFAATGARATPPADLAPGPHFARVRTATAVSPVWEFFVGARGAPVDASVGVVADLNGDGLADLTVGANLADRGAGRVYVHLGARAGLPTTADRALATDGSDPAQFGGAVAAAGDVDGDGFVDLLVGALNARGGVGRAALYRGTAAGPETTAATQLAGDAPAGNFGTAVAGAGDVDGDGYADALVGAPGVQAQSGRVYVYLGGPGGLAASAALTLEAPDGAGSAFGAALAGGADVNGDGYADVVVGASGAAGGAGRAYVYLGGPGGLARTPASTLSGGGGAGAEFGAAVAFAGDLDGDGYADVAVGAPDVGAGTVAVYPGGAAGVASAPRATLAGPDGDHGSFGWSVASAGDVDGDGYGDLVVGAPCAVFTNPDGGYPGCGTGRAYVFAGGPGGPASAALATLEGDEADEELGWIVAGLGDVDGDGFADVAASANGAQFYQGAAYVFRGGRGGPVTAPAWTLRGPDGAGANFGWSLAARDVRARARRPRA